MINFLISILGYILIWSAAEVGRNPDSKIPIFTIKWWLQALLIIVGCTIISNVDKWYPQF